jgi:diacylglycerol kinase family enzyme
VILAGYTVLAQGARQVPVNDGLLDVTIVTAENKLEVECTPAGLTVFVPEVLS